MTSEARGGTQWRPFMLLLLPCLLVVLILVAMTILGAMPLNLAVSGQRFKVASREGSEVFVPEGATAFTAMAELKDGTQEPVLQAGIPEAQLSDGVCLSLLLTFPKVGVYNVQLQTKGATRATKLQAFINEVQATNAEVNAKTGDGKRPAPDGSNVTGSVLINKDASDVEGLSGGHVGTLGIEAPGKVRIGSIKASGQGAVVSGTLRISGLAIPRISHGRGIAHGECY